MLWRGSRRKFRVNISRQTDVHRTKFSLRRLLCPLLMQTELAADVDAVVDDIFRSRGNTALIGLMYNPRSR